MQHTIKNDFIQVQIKEFGAELCSIQKRDDTLEYIWQGDSKYWKRHSPILFPIVGKLLDNEYIYKGITYQMMQHGFARDMLFKVVAKKENEIIFKLESTTETLKVYPFKFELFVTYKVYNQTLDIFYKVKNHSLDTMFFSIGAHPAFTWPLDCIGDKETYYLEFEDTKYLEILPLTPQGITLKKEHLLLKNNQLKLHNDLFKNDALVVNNLQNKLITFKNKTDEKQVKITFDNFPYVGIWSKPQGAPFICLEPWYGVADLIEHNKKIEEKKGMISLETNGVFESSYQINIS